MEDEVFIGFAKTATQLRKSRATVYRLVQAGLLTPYYRPKNPRSMVFRKAQVDALDLPANREPVMDQRLQEQARIRDGRCAICFATTGLVAHHVIPPDQGGADSLENLLTLCDGCHTNLHEHGHLLRDRSTRHGTQAIVLWLRRSLGLEPLRLDDR